MEAPLTVSNYQNAQDGIFNGPVHLARGRQARDPQAKTVTSTVHSLEEFETSLREYLDNPPEQPEHTECQLSFWIGTSFLVAAPNSSSSQPQHQPSQPHYSPDAPPGYQSANGLHAQQYAAQSNPYQSVSDPAIALSLSNFQPSSSANANANPPNSGNASKKPEQTRSLSILEALQPTGDPKEKMRKQRAIAKCCVDAIQKVDGYRYSFHNCWNSREDDSFRFSYYCNDSLLNKDRAANGKGAKLGKRATKPVYDCKGVLSVKFSASKQSLDVFYKHIPIHKTYEERAPPPRKDSKRRKFLEENDPDALERIQQRPKPAKTEPEPGEPPKPKKKKKPEDHKSSTSLESDLRAQSLRSLLELIRHDPAPEQTPPEPPQPPPPPPPPQLHNVPEQPPIQQQHQQQQTKPVAPQTQQPTRKRPRNSCDVCKAKKTKCDGTRPVCQTCIDKKRQCIYTDGSVPDDRRPSMPESTEPARQAQAATNELSELERMKRELEEAKARIHELEEEKRRTSITPSHTPQMHQLSRPPTQPQHQVQGQQPQSDAKPQGPPHPQQRQNSQHQHQRGHSQQQQQQMQMPNAQPQQAIQQLQNAAQQLQTSQQMPNAQQLQTAQYNHFNNHAPNPYGLNRPMSSSNMPTQNMPAPNAGHPPPSQNQVQGTGMTPTAEATNPYGRDFSAWPLGYYGYQSAQQHQPDQWAAARNSGVFR